MKPANKSNIVFDPSFGWYRHTAFWLAENPHVLRPFWARDESDLPPKQPNAQDQLVVPQIVLW